MAGPPRPGPNVPETFYWPVSATLPDPVTEGYDHLVRELQFGWGEVVTRWDDSETENARVREVLARIQRRLLANPRVDLVAELKELGFPTDSMPPGDIEAVLFDVREAVGMVYGRNPVDMQKALAEEARRGAERKGTMKEMTGEVPRGAGRPPMDIDVKEKRDAGNKKGARPKPAQGPLMPGDIDVGGRTAQKAGQIFLTEAQAPWQRPAVSSYDSMFDVALHDDTAMSPALGTAGNPLVSSFMNTLLYAQDIVIQDSQARGADRKSQGTGAEPLFVDMGGNDYIRGIKHWKWKPLLPLCFLIEQDVTAIEAFLTLRQQSVAIADPTQWLLTSLQLYFQSPDTPAIPPQAMTHAGIAGVLGAAMGQLLDGADKTSGEFQSMIKAFAMKIALFVQRDVHVDRLPLQETVMSDYRINAFVQDKLTKNPLSEVLSHWRPFYAHSARPLPNQATLGGVQIQNAAMNLMHRQYFDEMLYFQLFWQNASRTSSDAFEFLYKDIYDLYYESPVDIRFPELTPWEQDFAQSIDKNILKNQAISEATIDVEAAAADRNLWFLWGTNTTAQPQRANDRNVIMKMFRESVMLKMADSDEDPKTAGIDSDRVVRTAIRASNPYIKLEPKQVGQNLPETQEECFNKLLFRNFMQLRVRRHPWDVDLKTGLFTGYYTDATQAQLAEWGAVRPAFGSDDEVHAQFASLRDFISPRGHEYMLPAVLLRLARRRACIHPSNFQSGTLCSSYTQYDEAEAVAMLSTFFPERASKAESGRVTHSTMFMNFIRASRKKPPKGEYPTVLLSMAEMFHYEMQSVFGKDGYADWGMRAVSPLHAFSRVWLGNSNFFNGIGSIARPTLNIVSEGRLKTDPWRFLDQSAALHATWLINRLVDRMRYWLNLGFLDLQQVNHACYYGWNMFQMIPPFGLVYKSDDAWEFESRTWSPTFTLTPEADAALRDLFVYLSQDKTFQDDLATDDSGAAAASAPAATWELIGFELFSLLEWYLSILSIDTDEFTRIRDMLIDLAFTDAFRVPRPPSADEDLPDFTELYPPAGYLARGILRIGDQADVLLQNLYDQPSLVSPSAADRGSKGARSFLDFPGVFVPQSAGRFLTESELRMIAFQRDRGFEREDDDTRKRRFSQRAPDTDDGTGLKIRFRPPRQRREDLSEDLETFQQQRLLELQQQQQQRSEEDPSLQQAIEQSRSTLRSQEGGKEVDDDDDDIPMSTGKPGFLKPDEAETFRQAQPFNFEGGRMGSNPAQWTEDEAKAAELFLNKDKTDMDKYIEGSFLMTGGYWEESELAAEVQDDWMAPPDDDDDLDAALLGLGDEGPSTEANYLRPAVNSRHRITVRWYPGESQKPAMIDDGTEVGYAVRFYIPDSGYYKQVEWDDSKRSKTYVDVEVVGNPELGLAVAVVARRALRTTHSSDSGEQPHFRYRTRAVSVITNGQPTKSSYTLYDPSDDYKPAGALTLSRVPTMGGFENQLNEAAKVSVKAILDKFRSEMQELPAPLRPATRGMRLRRYTMALNKAEAPAWVFAFEGILEPPASEVFVDQLLRAASLMAGWPADGVLNTLKTLPFGKNKERRMLTNRQRKAIQLCFSAIAHVGNTNDYVSDVRKGGKPSERFQVPLGHDLGEGDCDDVAKEIQFLSLAIQRMPGKHPLARLLREYDISMVTAVATSPALQRFNNGDDGQKADKYICHMYEIATPVDMPPLGRPGRSKNPALQRELLRMAGFVGEGTNITSPSTREEPAYVSGEDALKEVSEAKWQEVTLRGEALPKSLDSIQYELPGVPTLRKPTAVDQYSAFYRYITNAWTFDPKGNFTEYHIMTNDDDDQYYGAEAYDVITGNRRVYAQPVIRVPASDKTGLRAKILRLLSFQHPIRAYHAIKTPRSKRLLTNPLLKQVYDLVSPLPLPVEYPLWRPFIELRLVHENNMTAQRLRDLKRLVEEEGWVLQGITSVNLAPAHTTYQLQLVPPLSVIPDVTTKARKAMP